MIYQTAKSHCVSRGPLVLKDQLVEVLGKAASVSEAPWEAPSEDSEAPPSRVTTDEVQECKELPVAKALAHAWRRSTSWFQTQWALAV